MIAPFAVQNSTLSAAALGELVSGQYRLDGTVKCSFWRKGMGDAYRITVGGLLYFLKVCMYARRSRKDIEEEVRLLLHLKQGGVSVAAPVQAADGRYVLPLAAPEGERYAVLYEGATGEPGTTRSHRKAFGKMVARMHLCSDQLQPRYERDYCELEHLLDANLDAIRALMINRKKDYDAISLIAEHAKAVIRSSLPIRNPEHGICHGDLFGGDVLFPSDGVPIIFDFDSSGIGWRALDIAVFTGVDWMDTSKTTLAQRVRRTSEFLEGYTTERALSNGEHDVLNLDGAVHHIFLMGIVLQHWTGRDGWHWANNDFIDWHMKWFRHWLESHRI
jgi:Ser/Thr protein kinase RdoA (MazF antagonist)